MDLELRSALRARENGAAPQALVTTALRRGLRHLSSENLDEVTTAARNWVWQTEDRIIGERADAFVAIGGCPSCGGHGQVVVWDTMDSMSGGYAEFGPCARSPEALANNGRAHAVAELPAEVRGTCTKERRETTGLSKAAPKTYRGFGQNVKGDTFRDFPITEEEQKELAPALATLEACETEKGARVVEVGRPVRIVRGFRVVAGKRKGRGALPLGLEGEVFWKGESHYGTRIGIRVGEGPNEIVWTSLGNVEVIR